MKKRVGWLTTIGGIITSILGILGAACVVCTPICGTLCITGLLATIAGVGIAAFFYKHHLIFIIVGVIIFVVGIILLCKCKKKSICSNEKSSETLRKNKKSGNQE